MTSNYVKRFSKKKEAIKYLKDNGNIVGKELYLPAGIKLEVKIKKQPKT